MKIAFGALILINVVLAVVNLTIEDGTSRNKVIGLLSLVVVCLAVALAFEMLEGSG